MSLVTDSLKLLIFEIKPLKVAPIPAPTSQMDIVNVLFSGLEISLINASAEGIISISAKALKK